MSKVGTGSGTMAGVGWGKGTVITGTVPREPGEEQSGQKGRRDKRNCLCEWNTVFMKVHKVFTCMAFARHNPPGMRGEPEGRPSAGTGTGESA